MMRQLLLTVCLCLAIGCASTEKTVIKSSMLNGSWTPIQQEIGGKALPKAALENQKLVINDSTYTFTAESVDKGMLTCSGNKMDIYGREGVNTGRHITAIYKLANDRLTICYNLAGDSYPEGFETKSKAKLFLCVFTKDQEK